MTTFDIIAVSSIVVASLAFVVTVWQAYISRHHNALSVQPIVEHNYSLDYKDLVEVSILNCGLGPAIVYQLTFYEPVTNRMITPGEIVAMFEASMNGSKFEYETIRIHHNTIVRAGECLLVFRLRRLNSDMSVFAKSVSQFDSCTLDIKYKSMYGDTFHYRAPTRVA